MKNKRILRKVSGEIIFEFETENNTIKKTIQEYISLCRSKRWGRPELSYANLSGADLRGVGLFWADFEGANLSGAKLRCVDLTDANLEGANLTDAQM